MDTIDLVVTGKVHERSHLVDEQQIAYRSASPRLAEALRTATKKERVTVRLGGFLDLVVGDTSAVWRVHNDKQVEQFDALFALLCTQPDTPMTFPCELGPDRVRRA